MSEHYSLGAEIGRGAFGQALKAIDKRDEKTYVIKRVSEYTHIEMDISEGWLLR
jgi:serine/threonine protein kinase